MWEFHAERRQEMTYWTWRCFQGGKVVASSTRQLASYSRAREDAEIHGFNATTDRWDISPGYWAP